MQNKKKKKILIVTVFIAIIYNKFHFWNKSVEQIIEKNKKKKNIWQETKKRKIIEIIEHAEKPIFEIQKKERK